METRQGTIEKKSFAVAKNQASYCTFTIDGMNYNTFNDEFADNFKIGDFVEIEGEVNDKGFWQLTGMKIAEGTPEHVHPRPQAKPTNGKEFHLSPEEVKCRALEAAITKEPNVTGEELVRIADEFVEWIRDGK